MSRGILNQFLKSIDGGFDAYLVVDVVEGLNDEVKPYRVYIPIGGIMLERGVTLNFNDVRLTTYDDSASFDAAFREPFLALQHPELSEDQIRRDETRYMDYLAALRWRPAVVFEVRTGFDNVRNIVLSRVQPIADYWQFCVCTIMRGKWIPLVDYRMSAVVRGIQVFPVVAIDHTAMSFPVLPGGAPAVLLTPERMDWLRGLGLEQLMTVFGTPDADEGALYDALLRRAIQNYADAERATSNRQKVLSYAASCELFFTRRKDTTIAVCHGIAKVLAQETVGQYDSLYREAYAMYESRSRTIHDGVTPSNDESERYGALAQRVILSLVKRRGEFADKSELDIWSSPPQPRSCSARPEDEEDA